MRKAPASQRATNPKDRRATGYLQKASVRLVFSYVRAAHAGLVELRVRIIGGAEQLLGQVAGGQGQGDVRGRVLRLGQNKKEERSDMRCVPVSKNYNLRTI